MSKQDNLDLATAYSRLTEGQRACLRLVRQHKTSKEIARILNISHFTVDQRVERACQTLGVEKRTDAALIMEQFSDGSIYEQLVYEQPDIAADGDRDLALDPTPDSSHDLYYRGQDLIEDGLNKGQKANLDVVRASQENEVSSWYYYPKGDPDAIPPKPRIRWIIQLMIQILVSILILVAIGQVLSNFAYRLWPVKEEAAKK